MCHDMRHSDDLRVTAHRRSRLNDGSKANPRTSKCRGDLTEHARLISDNEAQIIRGARLLHRTELFLRADPILHAPRCPCDNVARDLNNVRDHSGCRRKRACTATVEHRFADHIAAYKDRIEHAVD